MTVVGKLASGVRWRYTLRPEHQGFIYATAFSIVLIIDKN